MIIELAKRILKQTGLLNRCRDNFTYKYLAEIIRPELKHAIKIEKKFYSTYLKKGDLCFDIGANIGGKPNIFNRLHSRIVAVEPDPQAFLLLKRRFGHHKNIILYNCAIAANSGSTTLFIADNPTLSTIDAINKSQLTSDPRFNQHYIKEINVNVLTLDILIEKHGIPKYIKIATVGYEYEILKGLSLPIKYLSVTCNMPYQADMALNCVARIEQFGMYEFNLIQSHIDNGYFFTSWISGKDLSNKLMQLKGNANPNYIEIHARLSK
jgi:FkbM family methyltransferase